MLQHQQAKQWCRVLCAGLIFAPFFLGGCGGDRGPERVVASGTVTYLGKPIPFGRIRFVPVAGSDLPCTAATIVDGFYKCSLHGGVPVGTHNVQIEAYTKGPDSSGPLWKPQNYLPKRHGADSQLQITIEPDSREVTKNFGLIN